MFFSLSLISKFSTDSLSQAHTHTWTDNTAHMLSWPRVAGKKEGSSSQSVSRSVGVYWSSAGSFQRKAEKSEKRKKKREMDKYCKCTGKKRNRERKPTDDAESAMQFWNDSGALLLLALLTIRVTSYSKQGTRTAQNRNCTLHCTELIR